MKVTLLAIDIAKNVFHCHGVDDKGKILLRKELRRKQLLSYIAKLEHDIQVDISPTTPHTNML